MFARRTSAVLSGGLQLRRAHRLRTSALPRMIRATTTTTPATSGQARSPSSPWAPTPHTGPVPVQNETVRQYFTNVSPSTLLSAPLDQFLQRHIGPSPYEAQEMLYTLGLSHIDQVVERAIPQGLLSSAFPTSPQPVRGETEVLEQLKEIVGRNEVFRSYIGAGYYDCITPAVIRRNVLESPAWYTPYTPYQAEIAQGRLEALLNFQTMVTDLTGMRYANASLLDEGTAAGEAMQVSMSLSPVKERKFLVSQTCHPQVIDVVKTRARGLGIEVIVSNAETFDLERTPVKGILLQYPDTNGDVTDYSPLLMRARELGVLTVMGCDLLASTILTPPGELGADIAIGSAQRFGVPQGGGGPHAAFFATNNEKVLRKMPGRLVGVSRDAEGNPAIRLALQTREQHIRREKATSNICTAQALLATMSSMYAVYHGPEGLRAIGERVHMLTCILAEALRRLGHTVRNQLFFDTLTVKHRAKSAHLVFGDAHAHKINLRILDAKHVGISLNETVTSEDLQDLIELFTDGQAVPFTVDSLASEVHDLIDLSHLSRVTEYLTHPIFNSCRSEHEMLRYIHRLQKKDLSLTTSMMPLGSCTMKLNATSEMVPLTWEGIANIHPFVPTSQMAGYHQVFADLDRILCNLTGFAEFTFQPNSGAQGEYTGLCVIREYHRNMGQDFRDICLIPASAHGTNPASAVMAGMRVVVIKCDERGYLDMNHLREMAEKHRDRLAAMMITYPSTYGVFEETIMGACEAVHQNGGQVYMDGANMNAMCGLVRPADLGADVCHLNLHKTFCIPHGGGGPGMGPIGVADHLTAFLPNHYSTITGGRNSIGPVASAPFSSASILPITWMYLQMMGQWGVRYASQMAILNANYMRKRLEDAYHTRYTSNTGYCAHEFIIDLKPLKETAGIEVNDIAKRLMDYNFHAGTVSWPVPNSMMIEPTESESKEEMDRFCDALLQIREEIREIESGAQPRDNNVLRNAPHTQDAVMADHWDRPYSRATAAYPLKWVRDNKFWPATARIDSVWGDRHLVCSCPSIDAYDEIADDDADGDASAKAASKSTGDARKEE